MLAVGPGVGGEESGPQATSDAAAVLEEQTAYCQVQRIAGVEKPVVESRWDLAPGRHLVELECKFAVYGRNWEERKQKWTIGVNLAVEAATTGRYVLMDYVEAYGFEYAWIEDASSGIVMAGKRPGRMRPPQLMGAEELAANRDSFGTGAALAIRYTAPEKPINHFQMLFDSKVIADTYGNEDFSSSVAVAPGIYDVEVRVQNRVDYLYESRTVRVRFYEGKPRVLEVKASHWGKASTRLK